MAHRAIDVARYIVTKCTDDECPISNLQLQKILYYVQLNYFRKLGEWAFDDDMEAWQHGPVVPSVYREFMRGGSGEIIEFFFGIENIFYEEEREIIDRVTEKCRALPPWELVARTHRPGSPWDRVYKPGEKKVIPKEYIKEYARR